MKSTAQKGREAEDMALKWLQERGFSLLERNYRVGHKEIDLIMESRAAVHIIEVKALTAPAEYNPADRVDLHKQQLLASAANYFLRRNNISKDAQFDIVAVVVDGDKAEIEYMPEAFYPVYYSR